MMQHSPTMSSSSAAVAKANKRGVFVSSLQGPRPLPLSLPGTTSSSPPRPAKRPRVAAVNGDEAAAAGPVIVYEHTPKVIHARPDEFKALVQRLTGRTRTGTAGGGGGGDQEAVQTAAPPVLPSSQPEQDPLVLALGQQHVPALPLVGDHHHTPPVLLPPSPGGNFLLSPSSFLFSPATMQAIQELIC